MFKIFVGNLSSTTTEDSLRRLFGRYAEVDDIAIPLDTETGKPRGFAIVMIKDEMRGKAAMIATRGTRLDGKALVVNQAYKKGKAPPKRDRRTSSRYLARGRGRPSSGGSSSGGNGPGGTGGAPYSGGGRSRPESGNRSGGYGTRPERPYSSRPDFREDRPPRRDDDSRGRGSTGFGRSIRNRDDE